ncbi:MAG TPA: excinuclease ABC subunit UvrC, partial [Candidatus Eisenbacteria bacterium]|nr:excinuclease ABC subunit UvrC [Candidatus Eisenbacteria bacterium]
MSDSHHTFDARLDLIPQKPGVYLLKDASGFVIYVGKANNLPQRLKSYFRANPSVGPKVKAMISHIADFSYIICKNELEALILENNLIKKNRPKYNTLLRDDKEYPYIRVTLNEMYPRILKAYRVGPDRDEGARYYGPYLAGDLQKALQAIYRIFPVMTCKRVLPRDVDKERPCLKYYINRCIGPCKGDVSVEEYRASVDEICRFLDGQYDNLLKKIKSRMEKASENLEFEKAVVWRDRYQALEKLTADQVVVTRQAENIDVLGFARNGSEVCLQKLEIRNGRMIASASSFVQDRDESEAELLEIFVKQHYAKSSFIPKLILLPCHLLEENLISSYLSHLAGFNVELRLPQRGEKRKLADMALTNAKQNLQHHTLIGG